MLIHLPGTLVGRPRSHHCVLQQLTLLLGILVVPSDEATLPGNPLPQPRQPEVSSTHHPKLMSFKKSIAISITWQRGLKHQRGMARLVEVGSVVASLQLRLTKSIPPSPPPLLCRRSTHSYLSVLMTMQLLVAKNLMISPIQVKVLQISRELKRSCLAN